MKNRNRILIVDDEPRNRHLLQAMLKSMGYDSDQAGDGEEALSKLNAGLDLVLLDVMMPGMTGFEVAGHIRENPDCADVPIIMVTVLESKADRLRAVEAGANDFISKPVDKVELRIRMASLLKMKEARDEIKQHRNELKQMVEKRTEALREILETSKSIVETMPSGLLVFQYQPPSELFLTEVNPAAERILGITTVQLRGQEFDEIWPNARRQGITHALFKTMETGETFRSDQTIFAKEGVQRIIKVTGFSVPGARLGLAVEDITERRKAQRELKTIQEDLERRVREQTAALSEVNEHMKAEICARKHAENSLVQNGRLRAMTEMAGGVARSFVSFFQVVKESAGKAVAEIESGQFGEVVSLQEKILETAGKGVQLADRLEAVGTAQKDLEGSPRKELFDLAHTARHAAAIMLRRVENIRRQRRIEVSLKADLTAGCFIEGERTSIFDVMTCILRNAIEACGTIGEVNIITKAENGKALLQISDNGAGIPEQDLAKIFEPFWTTKKAHSGLGLAVSYAVVQRHTGTIRVESTLKKGSVFTVQFPLVDASAFEMDEYR